MHCDEAHRFMADSLEDLIAETRKYKVSLSLAHQYMSQFGRRKTDAFSSVGFTIIFNVDSRNAGYLVKDLQKKVGEYAIVFAGRRHSIAIPFNSAVIAASDTRKNSPSILRRCNLSLHEPFNRR